LVESVTHCVHSAVTNKVATETNRLLEQLDLSPHMVSIQWVVESLRLGKPVTEAEYPFPPPVEADSFLPPPTRLEPAPLPDTDSTQFEANLLAQYGAAPPPGDQIKQDTLTDTASMSWSWLGSTSRYSRTSRTGSLRPVGSWSTPTTQGCYITWWCKCQGGPAVKYKRLVSCYWRVARCPVSPPPPCGP
jgi:hypothetical protein